MACLHFTGLSVTSQFTTGFEVSYAVNKKIHTPEVFPGCELKNSEVNQVNSPGSAPVLGFYQLRPVVQASSSAARSMCS